MATGETPRRASRVLVYVAAAIVVLCAAGLGMWKGPHWIRGLQHGRFLAQAEEKLAAGDFKEAAFSLRKALLKRPESIPAVRRMADLAERTGSPQAPVWRARLVELEPDNPQNKLDWAQLALQAGDLPSATKALDALAEPDRRSAVYHKLSGILAVAMRNPDEAEAHFLEAIKLEPDNPSPRLNLAVIRLVSTNQAEVEEARTTLSTIATHRVVRLDALRHLTGDALRHRQPEQALGVSATLIAETNALASDYVLHLTALSLAATNQVDGFLEQAQTRFQESAAQTFEIATWMLKTGRHQSALTWIQGLPEPVRNAQPLPVLTVELYAAQNDLTGMVAFLESQDWGDLDFNRLALLAKAHRLQGQETQHTAAWRRAVRLAGDSPQKLLRMTRLAKSWGWSEEYESCLREVAGTYPQQRWAMQELGGYYYARGRTDELDRVLRRALTLDPTNATIKNNLAVTSLLIGREVDTAHLLAQEAFREQPSNPNFAATYGYSLLCQGREGEALTLFRSLDPKDLERPSIAAYYGLVLARSDQAATASNYLALATQARLLPEESNLVAQAWGAK